MDAKIQPANGSIAGHDHITESPIETTKGHVAFPESVTKTQDETVEGGAVQEEPEIKPLRKRTFSHIDEDDEYEYWRIPKGDPRLRDPTELPLYSVRKTDNKQCIIWAKMDTGADINVIVSKTVQRLGLEDAIYPNPTGSEAMFEAAGNSFKASRLVKLDFVAGRGKKSYDAVEFWIPDENSDYDTDKDGIPDVLLGWPFIKEKHMVMVDPEFIYEPEGDLEVLAKRSYEELEEDDEPRKKVMPTKIVKHPQIRGSKYG